MRVHKLRRRIETPDLVEKTARSRTLPNEAVEDRLQANARENRICKEVDRKRRLFYLSRTLVMNRLLHYCLKHKEVKVIKFCFLTFRDFQVNLVGFQKSIPVKLKIPLRICSVM